MCLGLFLENKLYWRKNIAWLNQSGFSKTKSKDNSTSVWNIPGLKAIWHFLDSRLNIQSLVTVIHLVRFMKLVWFMTNSGYYMETVISDELWFFFFQSEVQTKTQGIKSVFCLDFQLIFSELNIWQIRGQVYLLLLKALVLMKREFDSTFLILQRIFLLSFIKVRLSR